MKKEAYFIFRRMTRAKSAPKLAIATAIGVFIGILPSSPFNTAAVFIISAVFGLNIICLLAGEIIPLVFPAVSVFTQAISRNIFTYPMMRYLNMAYFLKWLPIIKPALLTYIISGFFISIVSFGMFFLIFRLLLQKNGTFTGSHVFSDTSGGRWPVMKVLLSVMLCVVTVVLSMVCVSINASPSLPKYNYSYKNSITNLNSLPKQFSINMSTAKDRFYFLHNHNKWHNIWKNGSGKKQVFAFYVSWDQKSLDSLKQNINTIDTVVPDWYTLNKNGAIVANSDTTQPDAPKISTVDGYISAAHKKEMPLVSNLVGKQWSASVLHKLVSSKNTGNTFINTALAKVESHHYSGINLDFESLRNNDKKSFTSFLKRVYNAFKQHGLKVTIDVPAQNPAYDYGKIINLCDNMIVMAYDENDSTGSPGSIASGPWISSILGNLNVKSSKVIMGLGNYGYDWALGSGAPADSLTFADVMDICSGDDLKIHWDNNTQNPYVTYKESNANHVMWFLDGATFYNQLKQSLDYGAGGVALWRLGSEDFTIWKALKHINNMSASLKPMSDITSDLSVSYSGTGEFLRISKEGKKGHRSFVTDKNGNIENEIYNSLPSTYLVKNFGSTSKKEIALSFDDGPDSYYTPKVLDILEKYHIKASFFLIGENAENNPELVQRIYNDGDDIGNHTFTHPNVYKVSAARTYMELNATQRLIQGITGHSTILFRAPYNADAQPDTLEGLIPVIRAQRLGYLMVGESIDPLDWQSPKKEVIINRVISNLGSGNIVLLHDGGGKRDNTIAALPELIKKLKSKGYSFITVNQLMNVSRDAIMPPVKPGDMFMTYDQAFFSFFYNWHNAVDFIFYLTIILGISRLLFLGILSARQKFRYKKIPKEDSYTPFVSVIIPSYNEKTVICRTIESVLNSDYKNFEVIVVDDGSTDNSFELMCKRFKDEPRLQCVRKENGGKSLALNRGLELAKGEIFIAIDADTLFDKDAIRLMVRYFSDPLVAAVSGNVKVGNRHRLLTQWQHCEYVTGFNLERRAYSELNCITVVPGAIGAWRKDIVLKHGGFKNDTLAEDTDMTLSLLQEGYHIAFEENARAYTESPETFRSLLKQRFRWTYGTLQCLWKHKSALFSRRQKTLGFIAMPFMWVFQYVFQTLSPIVDIYLLITLFTDGFSSKAVFWYIVFLGIDFISSIFAFNLEHENPLPLLWQPIQRIVYRFMMAYVVIKSIFVAIMGKSVGWNKLKRTGNAVSKFSSDKAT